MAADGTAPTALVTGANRGIGLEVCRQLAALDFVVLLGSRDPDKGRVAAEGLASDRVRAVALDVTDPASIAALAADLDELTVLVNCAGIDFDRDQSALEADLDRVRTAFETNLFGAWRLTQALAPLLRAAAGARIVNVSSGVSQLGQTTARQPGYATSKVALNLLTGKLAAELVDDDVLVNAVCPGWVATDMGGPHGRPVADGAASVVWAVTLPDDGPTGGFFRDGEPLAW